ncbi:DUF58 domain-containing protein [Rickettsiales bacterium]|nr:DUF58 domain-containing protein [Rickettsiales bacterium]
MIYPNFDELVSLQSHARGLTAGSSRKSASILAGNYASSFRGQGMEFAEVRQYVHGDDIRNIDWRVTARTSEPHLKVYTEERMRNVIICVESSPNMRFGTRVTFKSVQAARAAALLGWSANSHHDRVGGMVFGDIDRSVQYFSPQTTRQSLWKLLRLLSSHEHGKSDNIASLEVAMKDLTRIAKSGNLVFIIADFNNLDKSFQRRLSYLQRICEVVLLPVYDPIDMALPDMGAVEFADGDDYLYVNTSYNAGRKNYETQWQKNYDNLHEIAHRYGVKIIPLYTDKDVLTCLNKGLSHVKSSREAA